MSELQWAVVPAIPGTRIEWTANWCPEGSILVHAWLVGLDIPPRKWDEREEYGSVSEIDTSSAKGIPMVIDATGCLVDVRYADLEGTAGEVYQET